jgi:hypothetical protein
VLSSEGKILFLIGGVWCGGSALPPLMKYLYFLLPAYVIKYQFLIQLCNSFLYQNIIMLISSNSVTMIYFREEGNILYVYEAYKL